MEEHLQNELNHIGYNTVYLFNQQNKGNHMLVVGGGKAYNAYVKHANREESYDWDCKLLSATKADMNTVLQTIHNILHGIIKEMAFLESLLYSLNYNIHKDTTQYNIDIDSYISVASDNITKVGRLEIKYGNILITLLEFSIGDLDFQQYQDYYFNCVLPNNHIIGSGNCYVSLDYLKQDLIKISQPVHLYQKKAKAIKRLEIIQKPENIVCFSNCADPYVYDIYGNSGYDISDDLIQRDYTELQKNTTFLNSIVDYTGSGYTNINGELLNQYYFYNPKDEIHGKLDNIFDHFSTLEVKPGPFTLYRMCDYYMLKYDLFQEYLKDTNLKGKIIPNIAYLSCTYINAGLEFMTSFRSKYLVLFKIKCYNSKGLIVIDKNSGMPEEKEVLLDRRGGLELTNIKYDYIQSQCKGKPILLECLIIECNYKPPSIISFLKHVGHKYPILLSHKFKPPTKQQRIGDTMISSHVINPDYLFNIQVILQTQYNLMFDYTLLQIKNPKHTTYIKTIENILKWKHNKRDSLMESIAYNSVFYQSFIDIINAEKSNLSQLVYDSIQHYPDIRVSFDNIIDTLMNLPFNFNLDEFKSKLKFDKENLLSIFPDNTIPRIKIVPYEGSVYIDLPKSDLKFLRDNKLRLSVTNLVYTRIFDYINNQTIHYINIFINSIKKITDKDIYQSDMFAYMCYLLNYTYDTPIYFPQLVHKFIQSIENFISNGKEEESISYNPFKKYDNEHSDFDKVTFGGNKFTVFYNENELLKAVALIKQLELIHPAIYGEKRITLRMHGRIYEIPDNNTIQCVLTYNNIKFAFYTNMNKQSVGNSVIQMVTTGIITGGTFCLHILNKYFILIALIFVLLFIVFGNTSSLQSPHIKHHHQMHHCQYPMY